VTDPFENAPAVVTEDDGVPRDRYGRYLLIDPKTGKTKPWTRATTFAKSISDTYTLSMWSQRMVGLGVAQNPDLIATFASSTVNDRDKLNAAAEDAKNRAGAKTGANLGTAVHAFTQRVDGGEMKVSEVPFPWRRDVLAYSALLEQEGIEVLPDYIERRVLEPVFGIAGTFDRIVRLTKDLDVRMVNPATGAKEIVTLKAGSLVVFDLKTGRDLEYGWLEIAIQLAIYGRAKHVYDASGAFEEMPEVLKDVALVLHLPVGKGRAELHAVNISAGWEFARLCSEVRLARKARGLNAPIAVVEVPEEFTEDDGVFRATSERADRPAALAVREPEWIEKFSGARTIGDLSSLRREAILAKAWTPAVERKALERRDAILADTAAG
jgi:hypothetical protein